MAREDDDADGDNADDNKVRARENAHKIEQDARSRCMISWIHRETIKAIGTERLEHYKKHFNIHTSFMQCSLIQHHFSAICDGAGKKKEAENKISSA